VAGALKYDYKVNRRKLKESARSITLLTHNFLGAWFDRKHKWIDQAVFHEGS